jgi:hypothetical protein
MRDRTSITLNKPADTFRIAVVGSSIVMGYGVSDEEVFGRVFENRLNTERTDGAARFEVLNFGVGKQWAFHRLIRIQRKVIGFEPDALYYMAHQDELKELVSHPARILAHGLELPSQSLKDVARKAGVTGGMPQGAVQGRLQPYETEILGAIYRAIVDECRGRGIVPVWIYLPMPGTMMEDPATELLSIAKGSGFVVCDLSSWAEGQNWDSLFHSTDEYHPNAKGHQLIADALMRMVLTSPETLAQP